MKTFFSSPSKNILFTLLICMCSWQTANAQNDFYYTRTIEDNPRFADVILRAGGYGGAYTSGQTGLDFELIVAPGNANFQFRTQWLRALYSKAYQDYSGAPVLISENAFNKFMMFDAGADYFFWDTVDKSTARVGVDGPLFFADKSADVAALLRFSVAGRLGINYTRLMLSASDAPGQQLVTEDGRVFGAGATEEDQGAVYTLSTSLAPYLGISFNLGRGLMTRVKGIRDKPNYHFISFYTDLLLSARNTVADIRSGGTLYDVTAETNSESENFQETGAGFRSGVKAVYGRRFSIYAKFESGMWPGYLNKRFFWLFGAGVSANLQIFDTSRGR
jgi:hypothetical protein